MTQFELGLKVSFTGNETQLKKIFKKLKRLNFEYCQLDCWQEEMLTEKNAVLIKEKARQYDIEITAFWCGWPGPAVWDFSQGPLTLGLVPEAFRFQRMQALKKGSDFAVHLGVDRLITHCGFIPEDPNSELYSQVLMAIEDVVYYCSQNDQQFLFETGQETPVTLLRTIEELPLNNLGINLDPANLVMYGKGNSVDALDVFGEYVKEVHAKDGKYPVQGNKLGPETVLGEGQVNYPVLLKKLKEYNYQGTLTIEREISGKQQIEDIKKASRYLNKCLEKI